MRKCMGFVFFLGSYCRRVESGSRVTSFSVSEWEVSKGAVGEGSRGRGRNQRGFQVGC